MQRRFDDNCKITKNTVKSVKESYSLSWSFFLSQGGEYVGTDVDRIRPCYQSEHIGDNED